MCMKWDCQNELDLLIYKLNNKLSEHLDILYINAISKNILTKEDSDKKIRKENIEKLLKQRGYSMNYLLGRTVMVKAFTCVYIGDEYVEVWHDVKNSKSGFIHDSLLTGLSITLDYMERI